jgi:hypothetical protein
VGEWATQLFTSRSAPRKGRRSSGSYAELFDWQIEPFGGNYSSINTRAGSGINGGIGRSSDGTPWASFYVEVDDPQAVLDKATSLWWQNRTSSAGRRVAQGRT